MHEALTIRGAVVAFPFGEPSSTTKRALAMYCINRCSVAYHLVHAYLTSILTSDVTPSTSHDRKTWAEYALQRHTSKSSAPTWQKGNPPFFR